MESRWKRDVPGRENGLDKDFDLQNETCLS